MVYPCLTSQSVSELTIFDHLSAFQIFAVFSLEQVLPSLLLWRILLDDLLQVLLKRLNLKILLLEL